MALLPIKGFFGRLRLALLCIHGGVTDFFLLNVILPALIAENDFFVRAK